jgi:hypothetical protein
LHESSSPLRPLPAAATAAQPTARLSASRMSKADELLELIWTTASAHDVHEVTWWVGGVGAGR